MTAAPFVLIKKEEAERKRNKDMATFHQGRAHGGNRMVLHLVHHFLLAHTNRQFEAKTSHSSLPGQSNPLWAGFAPVPQACIMTANWLVGATSHEIMHAAVSFLEAIVPCYHAIR
jgi:hypothetical protein